MARPYASLKIHALTRNRMNASSRTIATCGGLFGGFPKKNGSRESGFTLRSMSKDAVNSTAATTHRTIAMSSIGSFHPPGVLPSIFPTISVASRALVEWLKDSPISALEVDRA